MSNLLKRNWDVIETVLKQRYGNQYDDYSNESWKTPTEWEGKGKIFINEKEEIDIKYLNIKNYPCDISDSEEGDKLILGLNEKERLEVINNLHCKKIELLHISQVKDKKIPHISDINSFEDADMYSYDIQTRDKKGFQTITNFIATYEKHEQQSFNVLAYHDIHATPLEIEKQILKQAVWNVGFIDEEEDGLAHELVKLSSCTYWMDKYNDAEFEKIDKVSERTGGKYYFQPDQRCFVIEALIYEDPRIASEVMTFEEWQKECA
tara:strand:- start:103 stop:894 length:792 start_codon:yes stop_codon:yes gene_type:complete